MLYDKDIREPLFEYLEEYYGKVRIIEEKNMGRSRADVVMIMEQALVGIEIKSDADTYARLSSQVQDYDRYFHYNIIAIGSSHAMHIKEHIPDWWGIITIDEIDGQPDFFMYREMKPNPKQNMEKTVSILWREELVHIQEINGLPRYKEKSKQFVRKKILEKVPEELLTTQLCEELFQRDYTEIAARIKEYRSLRRRR